MRIKKDIFSFKPADWLDFIKVNFFGHHLWDIVVCPITNGNYRYGLTCKFQYGLYHYFTGKLHDKKLNELLKDVSHYPFTLYHEIKLYENHISVRFFTDDLTDIVKNLLWCKDLTGILGKNAPEPYLLHMPFKSTKDKDFEYIFVNNENEMVYEYGMIVCDENVYYEYFTSEPKKLLSESLKLKDCNIKFYRHVFLGPKEIWYMQKTFTEFMNLIQSYEKNFKKEHIIVVFYNGIYRLS